MIDQTDSCCVFLQETIKEFERNMSEIIAAFVEQMQALFAQCRELENMHNEKLMEVCSGVLDKVIHNSSEVESLSEDLKLVLKLCYCFYLKSCGLPELHIGFLYIVHFFYYVTLNYFQSCWMS